MRCLELFAGTGSVGRWARAHGYDEVISVDVDPRAAATVFCDVMAFNYRQYSGAF